MRKIIVTVFLVFLFSASSFAEVTEIDCDKLEGALNLYFKVPTPDNAKAVYKLLPDQGRCRCTKKETWQVLEIFLGGHDVLVHQMLNGDRESINMAIRWLLTISDGHYSEEIDVALGKIITTHPELLLRGLKHNNMNKSWLGGIGVNTGEAYMHREKARCVEMRKRYEAISGVKPVELIELKTVLLSIIQDDLNRNCN